MAIRMVFGLVIVLGLLAPVYAADSWQTCNPPPPSSQSNGDVYCSNIGCMKTTGTTMLQLKNGETYGDFYAWITTPGVLNQANGQVRPAFVAPATADPNVHFADSSRTDCTLDVTFVYEQASYRNRLGLFLYGTVANLPTLTAGTEQTVFVEATANCYGPTGQQSPCLPPGATRSFGPFNGDANVGFYLDQNGACAGNSALRLYSVDRYNAAGRSFAVLKDPNTQRVYITAEDAPGGDQDFNDVIISFKSNCPLDTTKYPCGATSCRNAQQTFNAADCSCTCPTVKTCSSPFVFNDATCDCSCPPDDDQTCSGNLKYSQTTCSCQCPATPSTACTGGQVWDSNNAVCACVNPSPSPSTSPSNAPSPCYSMTWQDCQNNGWAKGCQVWFAAGCCSDALPYCAPQSCQSTTGRVLSCAINPVTGKKYEFSNACVPPSFTPFTALPHGDCNTVTCPAGTKCDINRTSCDQTSCCQPQTICK